jgi:lysophospholipase L1-like esterase
MRKNITASLLGIFLAIIILELCCQVYSLYLDKKWRATRTDPSHYYKASHNFTLGYELESNTRIDKDRGRLWINRFGIRELEQEIYEVPKIAILGDSIVFGNALSQEQTISSLLQQSIIRAGDNVKILNFGVPGYGLAEFVEHLKAKNKIYSVDHVIYILNSNDFTRRNSIYEGADAGLYRMYNQPLIKSPWFLRKAIYRIIKYSGPGDYQKEMASVKWYQWLFRGNMEAGYSDIKKMVLYANDLGINFTIVLFPAGVAYNDDGSYELSYMNRNIGAFLKANDIDYVDTTDRFASNVKEYFDPTDHLTFEGNKLMAEILYKYLEKSHIKMSSAY